MMHHYYLFAFIVLIFNNIGLSLLHSSTCIKKQYNRNFHKLYNNNKITNTNDKEHNNKITNTKDKEYNNNDRLSSNINNNNIDSKRNPSQQSTWRLYEIYVLLSDDPGKDDISVHDNLYNNVIRELNLKSNSIKKITPKSLPLESIQLIRKSFDPRIKKSGQPRFVYTVDVTIPIDLSKQLKLKSIEGKIESLSNEVILDNKVLSNFNIKNKDLKVVIVGAGPAGLFAALEMIEHNLKPIIIERGKPVEERGRDIGALFHRKVLNPNSNLCYGEGGAGTWSDGKLTTRIGKNSADVRNVLSTLVRHGAPEKILIDGKPHLGTDRLVKILRDMRKYLTSKGAEFLFDTTVDDIIISDSSNSIEGVVLSDSRKINADICVLAVGHSARSLYKRLEEKGVVIESKPIAVGFRVEHPQDVINRIQYGEFGSLCERGKGKVPVADYRLATEADSERGYRGVYSFCMCPGGQIVPTSVNPDELCVNGMSFSKRESRWANSALVVTVNPDDIEGTDILRGVQWQQEIERKAAMYGGGNLVCPVQRVTDFLSESVKDMDSSTLSSSYRMGVKYAKNHEIYPAFVTQALQNALLKFDRLMPGFITNEAVLHGVETRTSAPVQIKRDPTTLECLTIRGLYPTGEGAGYAGGIVSAAVDGCRVSKAIVKALVE